MKKWLSLLLAGGLGFSLSAGGAFWAAPSSGTPGQPPPAGKGSPPQPPTV